MQDFWPACGWRHLQTDAQGHLLPTAAWFGHWLDRPELALVAESCPAEIRLHQQLRAQPLSTVTTAALAAVQDADARENYRLFLALRDGLIASLPVFKASKFFLNAEMSIADIALAPLVWRLNALGVALPKEAHSVIEYGERIFRNPAYHKSMTESEKSMRPLP